MENQPSPSKASSIFQFTANTIDGKEVSLDKYRGNVCLVVNVASECGLSESNLPQLEELHSLFAEKGLRILAFPCNQFAYQEPGSNEEIRKRLEENFKISYDLFEKVDVNGSNAHPLFKYLQTAVEGTLINAIKWNYTKFLTDRNGVPMKRYSPTTSPLDMIPDIETFLAHGSSQRETLLAHGSSQRESNKEDSGELPKSFTRENACLETKTQDSDQLLQSSTHEKECLGTKKEDKGELPTSDSCEKDCLDTKKLDKTELLKSDSYEKNCLDKKKQGKDKLLKYESRERECRDTKKQEKDELVKDESRERECRDTKKQEKDELPIVDSRDRDYPDRKKQDEINLPRRESRVKDGLDKEKQEKEELPKYESREEERSGTKEQENDESRECETREKVAYFAHRPGQTCR